MVFYSLQSVLPQFRAAWQLVGFIKITFNTKSTLVTWQSRRPNWCLAGPRWKHIYAYLSVLGQCIRIEHYSLQSKTRRHFITQSNLLNFLHFASEQKKHIVGYSNSWDCSNAHAGVKSTSAKSCKARLRHQNVASWFQHLRHLSTYLYLIWLNYIHL